MKEELEAIKIKFNELFEINNYSVFLWPQNKAVVNNLLKLLWDIKLRVEKIEKIVRKRF